MSEQRPRKRAFGFIVAVTLIALPLGREVFRALEANDRYQEADRRFNENVDAQRSRRRAAAALGTSADTGTCITRALAECHAHATCDTCSDVLVGCLETARKDETYCGTVPRYTAATSADSESFREAQRDANGLTHWSCAAMFKFVQLHCHPLVPRD